MRTEARNFLVMACSGILLLFVGCDSPRVIYPQRKNLTETVYASGKIVSGDEIRVTSLSRGTVIKKLVNDGDRVQKGQLIYVINNEAATERYKAALEDYRVGNENLTPASPLLNDLRLALDNARLQCSNDSQTYFRYKILWAEDIGTQSNLDNVRLKYEASLNQVKIAGQKYAAMLNDLKVARSNAQSQLIAAGKDLKEYFIRSDRDGVVYQTFREAGEVVVANEAIALIGNTGTPLIRLAVDQQDIARIHNGQQVLIQTDITGDKIYKATVSGIYPVMNEQDQTFRVDAAFATNELPHFIHGSVQANIVIQRKEHALVLPRSLLDEGGSVWVKAKRTREKRKLKTGIGTLEYIEVVEGLDEKTPVLVINENKK